MLRRLEERDYTVYWTRAKLLEELRTLEPKHPLLCPLHDAYVPGGPTIGYSRNSHGEYATYAPGCIGCSYDEAVDSPV